ncbi:hypothetical protein PNEG_02017 [Pneumocystis murina B123]|uniref:Nuclear control of ATPase protein 2 n=1 Tax=Pneumocystis murina (strain B123) TaxID=1069680 RepID=M7NRW2_PNEMU|nr:hypothetical protein PNEG_02017 [Pneumocystis murina B123]EMR09836.1 hypothetical protein PNEG_02017 [Pneumocystis murina B123]
MESTVDTLIKDLRYQLNFIKIDNLELKEIKQDLDVFKKKISITRINELLKKISKEKENDINWLILSFCTINVYEHFLKYLFKHILPISEGLIYWNRIASSPWLSMIYLLQTLPLRIFLFIRQNYIFSQNNLSFQVFRNIKKHIQNRSLFHKIAFPNIFIHERSQLLPIYGLIRHEIIEKQKYLLKLQKQKAIAIGHLMNIDFNLEKNWKEITVKRIQLLSNSISQISEKKPETFFPNSLSSTATFLNDIINNITQIQNMSSLYIRNHGRPSIFIRYWLPVLIFSFSASSIFQIVLSKKKALSEWLKEFIKMSISFWKNWVISPIEKIVSIIHHDRQSEIALMSKKSLETDLQSLERMVVDFAIDNPAYSRGKSMQTLRENVRLGDLTSTLLAYEKHMKTPIKSIVTGKLIRSLLIQIQKTKVDVEVVINGIDKLLKSQELVFGFVGVMPGLTVCYLILRYFFGIWNKRNIAKKRLKTKILPSLRNIERILLMSNDQDTLSYYNQGLLLCEVQILRSYAYTLPANVHTSYLQDLHDLENTKTLKITNQLRVVDRILRLLQ